MAIKTFCFSIDGHWNFFSFDLQSVEIYLDYVFPFLFDYSSHAHTHLFLLSCVPQTYRSLIGPPPSSSHFLRYMNIMLWIGRITNETFLKTLLDIPLCLTYFKPLFSLICDYLGIDWVCRYKQHIRIDWSLLLFTNTFFSFFTTLFLCCNLSTHTWLFEPLALRLKQTRFCLFHFV